jgi:hypothetical protein
MLKEPSSQLEVAKDRKYGSMNNLTQQQAAAILSSGIGQAD